MRPENRETTQQSAKGRLASGASPELLEQRDGSTADGFRQLSHVAHGSRGGLTHGIYESAAKSSGNLGSFESRRQAQQPRRDAHRIKPGWQPGPQCRKPDKRRYAHGNQQLGDFGMAVGHEHDRHPRALAFKFPQ